MQKKVPAALRAAALLPERRARARRRRLQPDLAGHGPVAHDERHALQCVLQMAFTSGSSPKNDELIFFQII